MTPTPTPTPTYPDPDPDPDPTPALTAHGQVAQEREVATVG